jgi:hypothetical protein
LPLLALATVSLFFTAVLAALFPAADRTLQAPGREVLADKPVRTGAGNAERVGWIRRQVTYADLRGRSRAAKGVHNTQLVINQLSVLHIF